MIMAVGVLDLLKDLLFPFFCIGCNKEGEWWCENCLKKVNFQPFKITTEGALDSATALFCYSEQKELAKLIHDFKYNYVEEIKTIWKRIIFSTNLVLDPKTIVISIPLHQSRFRERGFNQAEIIGRLVAERYQLAFDCQNLKRNKVTKQQAKLTKGDRLLNVNGAFSWMNKTAPQNVLLVDDVYTTGATMGECAKVLKQNGATTVRGLVLAHG